MNFDRALGIIGLILTIVGFVYPFEITYNWILPLIGILAILYSVYIELLPPYKNKFFCFYYDLTENDKNTAKGKKITVYKINNIFNKEYVSNGYFGSFTYEDPSTTTGIVTGYFTGYYPQATTNFLVGATFRF